MFSLADSNFYYLSFFMNTGPGPSQVQEDGVVDDFSAGKKPKAGGLGGVLAKINQKPKMGTLVGGSSHFYENEVATCHMGTWRIYFLGKKHI